MRDMRQNIYNRQTHEAKEFKKDAYNAVKEFCYKWVNERELEVIDVTHGLLLALMEIEKNYSTGMLSLEEEEDYGI